MAGFEPANVKRTWAWIDNPTLPDLASVWWRKSNIWIQEACIISWDLCSQPFVSTLAFICLNVFQYFMTCFQFSSETKTSGPKKDQNYKQWLFLSWFESIRLQRDILAGQRLALEGWMCWRRPSSLLCQDDNTVWRQELSIASFSYSTKNCLFRSKTWTQWLSNSATKRFPLALQVIDKEVWNFHF